ncbi:MBL fold metallo-hydrolase [Sulfurirhabdus autotrophica]|uniref:Ribonuclease BN (tRNA processing enzyme) n=1 Tax=Sulfurirhabdus autotrophica TaxID=1706046 RepID=A0A4R3YDU3_9PROT|nr:MBL fold metallo-hydrolase [Sulfurirhabdus autotrophica]TCV90307.1 ribonuclease BN (tRNA processing enzyme) [Sulfurirhabdus autotrophica]
MKASHFVRTLSTVALCTAVLSAPLAYADQNGQEKPQKLAVDEVSGDLSVMVLGSGGPMATASGRASAGYLIFLDGKPRILMDIGGGAYQRLAASGANIKDLDIVLLSHLHIDHTGDLSAAVKTIYFHNKSAGTYRTAPIRIFGPGANGVTFPNTQITQYPGSSEYVHNHYDMPAGVERYLNAFAPAISGGDFKYTATDVSPAIASAGLPPPVQEIVNENGLVIKAIGVFHGPVPALGFRIDYKGKSIAYSGDTNSKTNNMITLSEGANMLIYDTAITDTMPDISVNPKDALFYQLHTTPSRMGVVARQAHAQTLVLSHLTPITEPRLDEVKTLIRAQGYTGKIKTAKDLKVYNLPDSSDM